MHADQPVILTVDGLTALIDALKARGYRVLGPTLRDQAIVYDDIDAVADLPKGWTDEQDGGHYRVVRRDDDALFGYAVGPHSWKKFLHPPVVNLWHAKREGDTCGSSRTPRRPSASPSSACAPARSPPSPSRTAC